MLVPCFEDETPHNYLVGFWFVFFLIFQLLSLVVTLLFRTVLGRIWQLVLSQHL